ncbi:MAG: LysR family transcriptional regulator [Proteobacteria bacterium]|nr:MAG: LysR family transcriptional regulator [Pseudomonadota bacterium]
MPGVYRRDLDLNLLRVFAVVADAGSVTEAASRLYLTQPAVSAALRRLTSVVGAPLFVRSGRGLALSSRGERLRAGLQPHLQKIVEATLEPPTFDPRTTTRTIRLGLADADDWLLPPLLRVLANHAPGLRIIVTAVQFRSVAAALAGGLDMACSLAEELPPDIVRMPLVTGGLVCLYDPRVARIARLTEAVYFKQEHIVVSYNGDLRGVVEDVLGKNRDVRVSVPSFAHVGALVEGTARLATIPAVVASSIRALRPGLRIVRLPFELGRGTLDLLWPLSKDDDEPCRYVRGQVRAVARKLARAHGLVRR